MFQAREGNAAIEETHDEQEGVTSQQILRRRFFRWLGGAAALGALGITAPPTALATKVPMPTYLPPGYRFFVTATDEPDGFRTGPAEIKFVYVNPAYWGRLKCPLLVFVSPPTAHDFEGTNGHTPEPLRLTLSTGEVVEARYFDGMWRGRPEGEAYALTFPFTQFLTGPPFAQVLIGLRGFQKGKVDRSELIKIAESIS